MPALTFAHLSDPQLRDQLAVAVLDETRSTATVVALIAEFAARRLFAPAGYPSMTAYCVGKLRLSEDAAAKRIQVARKALLYPAVLDALAEGRVHLTGLRLLCPHFTTENVDELLAAATHRTMSEIELMIARRFPATEHLPLVETVPSQQFSSSGTAPGVSAPEHAARHVPPVPPSKMAPVAQERYVLHVSIDQETHDMLRQTQEMLGHTIPNGDVAQVLKRALGALKGQLEKRKLGATNKPQARPRGSGSRRTVPAHVKRAVQERDRGRCTFVGEGGLRCETRRLLEYDHIVPIARGGASTVQNVRLRCHAHNQLEAERVFGAGFMEQKREGGRRAAETRAAEVSSAHETAAEACEVATASATRLEDAGRTAEDAEVLASQARDVMSGLRYLGCRADRARLAVEHVMSIPDATLEQRMRAALRFLAPKVREVIPSANAAASG